MEARMLGDYRLIESISEEGNRTLWLAEQASIQRRALLIELTDLSQREAFLAEMRVKAAVEHPKVVSVYEAADDDTACFAALERPSGTSLAKLLDMGGTLEPIELAAVLRDLAEAAAYFNGQQIATAPLGLENIHRDASGLVAIDNVALSGEADPSRLPTDFIALGSLLVPLVATDKPGASRVLTVLGWMRGEGLNSPLHPGQILTYAEQIESQLLTGSSPTQPVSGSSSGSKAPLIAGILVGLAAIAGGVTWMLNREPKPPPEPEIPLPGPIAIPAGTYPTPDGGEAELEAFRLSAHEVTIGEYLAFLETLEQLQPKDRSIFDRKDQPEDKSGHRPEDWDALLDAARRGGTWKGREVSLQHPIVGIDWWDIAAYCEWRDCRLPTQEEWFAALRMGLDQPEQLQPSPWSAVTRIPDGDKTPAGFLGMAGSVSEWTLTPTVNPANPLGVKRPTIIGASYLAKRNGALAREWTDDLRQRRPDLGFRVVILEP